MLISLHAFFLSQSLLVDPYELYMREQDIHRKWSYSNQYALRSPFAFTFLIVPSIIRLLEAASVSIPDKVYVQGS